MIRRAASAAACLLLLIVSAHADAAFQQWLQTTWPQAQALGVSRATFDAATRGLEPDLSLPDLAHSRPAGSAPQQPEFVQTPAQYLREPTFDRLAARGKQLAAQYHDTLARIEKEFGVPGNVVLAIWARETDYGGYKLPLDAIRTLATQAYVGKRKDFFRNEFLHALKMLQDGVPRADMRSSWGGAMGLTQFLPSEFYKYAVDFDGDGRADIWHSVPDALASAAKQLAGKGWQAGEPLGATRCARRRTSIAPIARAGASRMPIGEWLKRGFVPAYGRKLSAAELALPRPRCCSRKAAYGPAFLTPKNYYVLKDYNFSDLYVLFVGHLSDRIAGGRPFADAVEQERAAQDHGGRDDAAAADRARALQGQDRRQGRHAHARGARRLSEEERAEGRLLADRGGARPHAAVTVR